MLSIFLAIGQTLLNSGFGSALIQKKDSTDTDICSIFYFNMIVGIIAYIAMCLMAPFIAGFYNQPILIPLVKALSFTFILNSIGLIHSTLLIKEINFKLLTKASIFSALISGIIGVLLAAKGFGVWSLVISQLSNSVFRTLFLWIVSSWRPSLLFSLVSLKSMFGFGSKLLLTGLLKTAFDNALPVVIGRLYLPSDLGYYTRAKTLQELPSTTIFDVVGRVTFPVFSKLQHDMERLLRGFKKALTVLAFVNCPLMVGLLVLARPLIVTLFTEKWIQSVEYFQVFCVVGIFAPLQMLILNLLTSIGRSDLVLKLEITKNVIIVMALMVTYRYGVLAMVYSIAISSVLYYIACAVCCNSICYTLGEQFYDISPYIASSAIMGSVMFFFNTYYFHSHLVELMASSIIGIAVYFIICWTIQLRGLIYVKKFAFEYWTGRSESI